MNRKGKTAIIQRRINDGKFISYKIIDNTKNDVNEMLRLYNENVEDDSEYKIVKNEDLLDVILWHESNDWAIKMCNDFKEEIDFMFFRIKDEINFTKHWFNKLEEKLIDTNNTGNND